MQDARARLGEPRKLSASSNVAVEYPRRLKQILGRVADRPVVVHDRDERPVGHVAFRG
jgi:hypothetical protein